MFAEGIHKENSPGYHLAMINLLESLEDCNVLSNSHKRLLQRSKNNSYWFILPNGKLLNFGDSNLSLVKKDIYDSNINRKEFKFFKKSAYFIVKTNTSYFA